MTNSNLNNLNGWIILDKQSGVTSRQLVTRISKILNVKKIGHAGTLDPLASGVLPIAIGEATKSIRFVSDEHKTYTFKICWGVETSTDDKEGTIVKKTKKRPKKFDILKKIEKFIGEIDQSPPIYSAIKINGKRAYNIARSGKIPELKKRKVTIFKFILKKIISEDEAEFTVKCSKGTYIRSLARDLGNEIGVLGHVSMLKREEVGTFLNNRSISLDQIKKLSHNSAIEDIILPILYPINANYIIEINDEVSKSLIKGKKVLINFLEENTNFQKIKEGSLLLAIMSNIPIAICYLENCFLKPKRVFNL